MNWPGARRQLILSVLFAGVCLSSWAVLFVSLEMGRTTPTTLSRGWLAAFTAAMAGLSVWKTLVGLAIWRVARLKPASFAVRVSVSAAPLLLSAPFLLAVYLSDAASHYLAANPIPRALTLWSAPIAMLAWEVAILVWTASFRPQQPAWFRSRRSTPLLIFAAFAVLYIFTAGGHLYSPDEGAIYLVAQSLAERGSVAIPNDQYATAAGQPPVWYSKYGLVPSVLAVPPYWISQVVGLEPDPPSAAFPIPNGAYPLVDLLVNPLITAATCAVLFSLARRLGFRATTSLAVVIAYGLGTSAWVYSKTLFSQPIAGFFLLAAVYLLVRHDPPRVRESALAGLCLGLAAGARAEMILIAAPISIPLLRNLIRDRWKAPRLLCAFGVSFISSGGITLGWYNYVKTGSILSTGHGSQGTLAGFSSEPWIGLFGTLSSPGFGLLLYNPIVLVGALCLPLLAHKRRLEAHLLGAILALAVVFYGSFGDWFAGFTWGNRYLVSVLPFAVLPIAVLLERPWRSTMSLLWVWGTVLLGTAITMLAVLFDFNSGWLNLWDHRANLDQILWDPHFSPILSHLHLLRDFLFTGAKLDLYLFYKLGLPSLLAFVLLFSALLTLAYRSALHSDQEQKPGS